LMLFVIIAALCDLVSRLPLINRSVHANNLL
jgi:hypothetical protein